MAPAVKKDKTFTVKAKNASGEIELWGSDKGLHIRWFCGETARWRPERARDQYQRLLMVAEHWQGVQIEDRADTHSYYCVRDAATFSARGAEFSWAQFRKALDAAMKQIPAVPAVPANPQPKEGTR